MDREGDVEVIGDIYNSLNVRGGGLDFSGEGMDKSFDHKMFMWISWVFGY